jgi:hypothetical protein
MESQLYTSGHKVRGPSTTGDLAYGNKWNQYLRFLLLNKEKKILFYFF